MRKGLLIVRGNRTMGPTEELELLNQYTGKGIFHIGEMIANGEFPPNVDIHIYDPDEAEEDGSYPELTRKLLSREYTHVFVWSNKEDAKFFNNLAGLRLPLRPLRRPIGTDVKKLRDLKMWLDHMREVEFAEAV